MAAFDPSRGAGGAEVDLNDILSQMFGMNMGGMPGRRGPGRPRKGPPEQKDYSVTLEELYKGKTVKFQANKQLVCTQCKGSGGKDKAKANTCEQCKGAGIQEFYRQVGPGLIRQERAICDHCHGSGNYFKEKDRCKKCKGKRTIKEIKALEIYIPRGAIEGDKIVLEGEADQEPDQEPGDIVFTVHEEPHEVFNRIGNDLSADMDITLSEALGGFSRVVLKHLDGRGIHINHPRGKIMRPGQVLKVAGEGMPLKRGDAKGDLYLIVKIEFPEDGWLKDETEYDILQKLLPPPEPPITVDEFDEVDYDSDVDLTEVCMTFHLVRSGWFANKYSRWEPSREIRDMLQSGRMTRTRRVARLSAPPSKGSRMFLLACLVTHRIDGGKATANSQGSDYRVDCLLMGIEARHRRRGKSTPGFIVERVLIMAWYVSSSTLQAGRVRVIDTQVIPMAVFPSLKHRLSAAFPACDGCAIGLGDKRSLGSGSTRASEGQYYRSPKLELGETPCWNRRVIAP
jgi:DnaJ family protein A protein 2